MDQDAARILRRLTDLARIPSPTGQEAEIQAWLARVLGELGFEVRSDEILPGRPNLYARRGLSRFLIATHVDTVPLWGHPRGFDAVLQDGLVCGRGVVDTKGQTAALLAALEATGESVSAALAFFVDEENEAKGSEAFCWPWSGGLEGAVVLEPTNLGVATAQAGTLELVVEVPGTASHGATFRERDNAILRALDLISELRSLPFWRSENGRFGQLGVNVGRIEGGFDVQLTPDLCKFQIDLPVLPEHGLDAVRDGVLTLVERWGARYEVHHHDPPFVTPPDAAVLRELTRAFERATGTAPRLVGMSAWTDAQNLVKAGLPSVILGAGELAVAHTPSECVELGDLLQLSRVLQEFLEGAEADTSSSRQLAV
ncbi:MAG: M20 family metallopeptidase [Calditrichaeota bacterium]|nr:M20 family metallopeptidase [Calditrichota bacterium]